MKLSEAINERTVALENLIEAKAKARDLVEQLLDDSQVRPGGSVNHMVARDSLHSLLGLIERYQVEWRACCEKVAKLRSTEHGVAPDGTFV